MTRLADALPADCTLETRPAERHNRSRFVLTRDGTEIGTGTHFTGARHIQPWIELQPAVVFDPDDSADRALFAALTDALDPGSHLMVHYLEDSTTAEAITAQVPPMATPLGHLMWMSGVRWFKDWYFTEGWMEGDQKLQGNLPVDPDHRAEREAAARELLEDYLDTDPTRDRCAALARRVLEELD